MSFNNLEKFTKFKGVGVFEAELNTAVNRAYAAIEQVQNLALALTDSTSSLLAVSSPFKYLPLKEKIKQIEHVKEILQELKIPKEKINNALDTFVSRVRADHVRLILVNLNQVLPEKKKLFSKIGEVNFYDWDLERVYKTLSENDIKPEGELKESILDLEYYEKNRKLRREDIWQG